MAASSAQAQAANNGALGAAVARHFELTFTSSDGGVTADASLQPIPESFRCPITHEVMVHPVLTVDGHCYERDAILAWFQRGNNTSPLTNLVLPSTHLVSCDALKAAVQEYLRHRPEIQVRELDRRAFEAAAQQLQAELHEKQVVHDRLLQELCAVKSLLGSAAEMQREQLVEVMAQANQRLSDVIRDQSAAFMRASAHAAQESAVMRTAARVAQTRSVPAEVACEEAASSSSSSHGPARHDRAARGDRRSREAPDANPTSSAERRPPPGPDACSAEHRPLAVAAPQAPRMLVAAPFQHGVAVPPPDGRAAAPPLREVATTAPGEPDRMPVARRAAASDMPSPPDQDSQPAARGMPMAQPSPPDQDSRVAAMMIPQHPRGQVPVEVVPRTIEESRIRSLQRSTPADGQHHVAAMTWVEARDPQSAMRASLQQVEQRAGLLTDQRTWQSGAGAIPPHAAPNSGPPTYQQGPAPYAPSISLPPAHLRFRLEPAIEGLANYMVSAAEVQRMVNNSSRLSNHHPSGAAAAAPAASITPGAEPSRSLSFSALPGGDNAPSNAGLQVRRTASLGPAALNFMAERTGSLGPAAMNPVADRVAAMRAAMSESIS
eukprot:gnl/TRDRNA2_/TRDRNA2_166253_c0_seq1.p1 gnl/TRDRNA2_/TRDRNA2_166253_c0~~gnl/TRDRNA2_/TRDRNA2_166253_c0_seq1.p1  ORF type:complete len:606 (+),score=107.23 gnl/TRDRNA2_/TRDRNA2_166253_c0_seq1:144-1961(+)